MKKSSVHFLPAGVCAPSGFFSSGVACGIKKNGNHDLALVYSETPCTSAGTFTTSAAKAAPVIYDLKLIRKPVSGVILNSGNANAATGKPGMKNTMEMSRLAQKTLAQKKKAKVQPILVCSTGRIGIQLPMPRIKKGIQSAVNSLSRKDDVTPKAIMTSDTFPKSIAARIHVDGKTFFIGGMAKGAGMIQPGMSATGSRPALHATMLCVLTTDLKIPTPLLQKSLNTAVGQSFNRITIDGDMSTNDTVLLLANGKSGVTSGNERSPVFKLFQQTLNEITRALALMIVKDGEGISRVVSLCVKGARSAADAEAAIRAIGNSALVKCAWFGGDPNWGRLLAAIGYSGAKVNPDKFHVYYDDIPLVQNGLQINKNVKKARKVAGKSSFMVTCDLSMGKHKTMLYTTDLTEKYVEFNKGE